MCDSSPKGWKKPSDIMKMRKKRKSENQIKTLAQKSRGEMLNQPYVNKQPIKRRNPFKCSSSPKRAHYDQEESQANVTAPESELLGMLDQPAEIKHSFCKEVHLGNVEALREVNPETDKTVECNKETQQPMKEEKSWSDELVVDWNIKLKARFTSRAPFTWCSPLRTMEEAAGVTSFVHSTQNHVQQEGDSCSISEAAKAELQKHCMLWYHPNLPWFKLFPRAVPDNQIGKNVQGLYDEEICKALLTNWVDSFTSVFHMLRARHCPFFYLSCHQFTVLFRAPGVGGKSQIHAILTPTTRGFREALKKEGIEFDMPLYYKKQQNENSNPDKQPQPPTTMDPGKLVNATDKVDEEDDDDEALLETTNEGASSWLESMGLEKSRFPSLNPNRVKLQREGYKVIDNRPESMVYVEGGDTQALYNYLLNSRSCIASSGVQAGIPPTIMAPSTFKGATLHPLKVKPGSVKLHSTGGSTEPGFSLEVWGPLLPQSVQGLCRLFSKTQNGGFSARFSTDEFSVAFNTIKTDEGAECSTNSLIKSGLDAAIHGQFITDNDLGKTGIREIESVDGKYIWSS